MSKKRPKTIGSVASYHSTHGSRLPALSIGKSGRPTSAKDWFEAYNKRRNEEAWRLDEWKSTVNYFQKRDLQIKFYNNLSQSNGFQQDDHKTMQEKEEKLKQKRGRLRQLLQTEEKLYFEEKQKNNNRQISNSRSVIYPEVQLLRAQLEDLRKKNEEESKRLSEKLSYEMWRKNTPNIRQMESDRLNRFVCDAWMGQKEWKEEQNRRKMEERLKFEAEGEEKRRAEVEEQQKFESNEIQKINMSRMQLDEQINNLRSKQEDEMNLKLREKVLHDEKFRLEQIIDRREEQLSKRSRKDLEAFWSRQFNLKLKKKSLSIQKELLEDELLIEELLKAKDGQCTEDEEKCEANWLKGVISEQKKLETLRDKEYDRLFSEESEQMWNRRELEWEREKIARNKLMQEVIDGRKKQVHDVLCKNKVEMNQNMDRKSHLISSIEDLKSEIESATVARAHANSSREEPALPCITFNDPIETSRQISGRHRPLLLSDEEALSNHRIELKRLEVEIDTLWQKSYVPPKHGRKKVAW